MDTTRFAGKVGVVTGGAGGIGRAIATRFVAEGGKIVVGDVKTDTLEEITAELGAENCRCVYCDVTDRKSVDAMIQTAYDVFGGFDVMFGNSGINLMKDFLDFTEEENERIFRVNAFGCFNTTQAAGRAFVAHETKGAIVNTASINVRLACPNSTSYAATKGAIAAMTRGAAVEFAKYGIRCNCVAPRTHAHRHDERPGRGPLPELYRAQAAHKAHLRPLRAGGRGLLPGQRRRLLYDRRNSLQLRRLGPVLIRPGKTPRDPQLRLRVSFAVSGPAV